DSADLREERVNAAKIVAVEEPRRLGEGKPIDGFQHRYAAAWLEDTVELLERRPLVGNVDEHCTCGHNVHATVRDRAQVVRRGMQELAAIDGVRVTRDLSAASK